MAVIGVLRLAFLLLFRSPALAQVIGTGLSESERLYDRDMHLVAHYDNVPTTDDIPFKGVACRVSYDVAGRKYRTDVTVLTHRGYTPDLFLTIWYDRSDPTRATGIGPEWALAMLLPLMALAIYHYS